MLAVDSVVCGSAMKSCTIACAFENLSTDVLGDVFQTYRSSLAVNSFYSKEVNRTVLIYAIVGRNGKTIVVRI